MPMPEGSREFPSATVPETVTRALETLAGKIRRDPACFLSVNPATRKRWRRLLREWMQRDDIPLLIRKSTKRGSEVVHASGRRIVLCDNSPAVWACGLALQGETPSLSTIRSSFAKDVIPVAIALKREERDDARFRCMLRTPNVNTFGWKLCHVEAVGMRNRTPLDQIPITEVRNAFWRFLNPDNYFLLPKSLGGLGEVDAVRRALSDSDATRQRTASGGRSDDI